MTAKIGTFFEFRSVFARLFVSVFVALLGFAVAMILMAQLVHNNSDSLHSRIIAGQIMSQVEPMIQEAQQMSSQDNLLQTRLMLVVVKRSFDFFDESLSAKIGLYSPDRRLIIQTENSDLPIELAHETSLINRALPGMFTPAHHHVVIESSTGYFLWYESRATPKERPWLAAFNLFTGTILLISIMALVLWWIAHNMTWRLNQMSRQMVKLGNGDFSVRVVDNGNDEIAALAYGFNQSAQKIEQLINANSLLLAHASHEFRTPITRIRLQLEMMDMLASKLPEADKQKFDKRVQAVNKDLTGLNELVESILLVSRLDAGHALQAAEQTDLYELVRNECQHYPEATLFAESVIITAQPKLLTHLVRNLLNNAMIHGVPPVQVYLYAVHDVSEATQIPPHLGQLPLDVDVITSDASEEMVGKTQKLLGRFGKQKDKDTKNEPNFAVLAFIDQGEGIAVDKRDDIFSPFVRLKQEKKGSGLGLSLVAQITEAHGGSISTDTWQGHTRFLVILPLDAKKTKSVVQDGTPQS